MSKQPYRDPYAKRPPKGKQAAPSGSPFRMKNMNPYMKRRIRVTYLVIAVLLIGIWYIAGHYGYWFGTKTEDGFKMVKEAPFVDSGWTEAVITDRFTGENTYYIPDIDRLDMVAGIQRQTVNIGNHPDCPYFLSFILTADGPEETYEIYRSALYGQGQGAAEVDLEMGFDQGEFPVHIEYRFYIHYGGMLHFVTSETRDITVSAAYPPGAEKPAE